LQHIIVGIVVAVAYIGLAFVSKAVSYAPGDAWTCGSRAASSSAACSRRRARAGRHARRRLRGRRVFALTLGVDLLDALGYGAIEVVTAGGRR
jgi:hypothetical protein